MMTPRPVPVTFTTDRARLAAWWRAITPDERADMRAIVDALIEWQTVGHGHRRGLASPSESLHALMGVIRDCEHPLDWITEGGLPAASSGPELWIELPEDGDWALRVSVAVWVDLHPARDEDDPAAGGPTGGPSDGLLRWARWVEPECLMPESGALPGVLAWLERVTDEALAAIVAQAGLEDALLAGRQWGQVTAPEGPQRAAEATREAAAAVRALATVDPMHQGLYDGLADLLLMAAAD